MSGSVLGVEGAEKGRISVFNIHKEVFHKIRLTSLDIKGLCIHHFTR